MLNTKTTFERATHLLEGVLKDHRFNDRIAVSEFEVPKEWISAITSDTGFIFNDEQIRAFRMMQVYSSPIKDCFMLDRMLQFADKNKTKGTRPKFTHKDRPGKKYQTELSAVIAYPDPKGIESDALSKVKALMSEGDFISWFPDGRFEPMTEVVRKETRNGYRFIAGNSFKKDMISQRWRIALFDVDIFEITC